MNEHQRNSVIAKHEDDDIDFTGIDMSDCGYNEHLLIELCWSFFMRGLALKLGPLTNDK